MNIKKIDNILSEEFINIVKLGDDNSKTLGFLPKVAFEKYAKQKQLIGYFDSETKELLAYLLYRISYNRVTIVHCCVDERHRNKKIAQELISYLKKHTKQYEGIRLSCRNDYGIDSFWESLGFVPMIEKKGRSKKGLPLTIWWYPHYKNDLLTQISDYELNNKIVAVIDMNVFLDIKDERHQESLALNSDWLLSEAVLYVTREIHVEINRAKTSEIKESSRKLLSGFDVLVYKDEDEFLRLLSELKEEFSFNSKNDISDLNHIAYSIAGGAHFFITRDKRVLEKQHFFEKYDLKIYRPSEFITHLDENIQVSKYKPQRLIGTSINTKSITSENIEFFTNLFLKPTERKSRFQKIIRDCLAFPDKFELSIVSKKEQFLAFIIFDRSSDNFLKIPVFRFLKSSLKTTLCKHLLFKTILISIKEERSIAEIGEKYLENDVIEMIKEARFTLNNNVFQKINLSGVVEKNAIKNIISKDIAVDVLLNEITNKNNNYGENEQFLKTYSLERHLSPVKIKDLEIPTYIVPIKPYWAEQLFDDKSNEKLNLFEPEYELLLNRENVYYRSAIPKVLESPSRILWYLSENKQTKEKGRISACSYVDEIFIDEPKKMFKQFEQLGIYKWKHISKTAGDKDKIMAFVFSDTELFKSYIPLDIIKPLFKKMENKNFMLVTPTKIKTETYLALYKLGMKYD